MTSSGKKLRHQSGRPAVWQHLALQLMTVALLTTLFVTLETWHRHTGLSFLGALAIGAGGVTGFAFTTALHEYCHYLGARFSGGIFSSARNYGLQIFDWDYQANSLGPFFAMSLAGSLGSIAAILFLMAVVPTDTPGGCALIGGACGSLVFAAIVEWPVLWRVRGGVSPLAALSRISPLLLAVGFTLGIATATVIGSVLWYY